MSVANICLADIEFHSFYWDNFNIDALNAHKKVMHHFGLNVQSTQENIQHGLWLDRIIGQAQSKVVAIIEPDRIPLNKQIIEQSIKYVLENDTFLGNAQVSNHIHPATHIFTSPAFFFITPSCYRKLGSPSFVSTDTYDVAEKLCYIAEERGIAYRTLFPTCFEREPSEGIWKLSSYGHYGVGTVFANSVYHLFQSRMSKNVELFIKRCNEVIEGKFDSSNFISSTSFDIQGKIASAPHAYPWFCKTKTLRRWYRSYKKTPINKR